MNLKTILATTALLFTFGQSFSQDTKTLDSANYKINYPADWLPSYMSGYGAELYVFTPQNDNTEFQENISLSIQKDLTNELNDLEKYTESVAASLETFVKDLIIIEKSYHENSFSNLEYTGFVYDEKTNFYQRIYFQNNQFYVLTFTFKPESDASYKEKAIKAFDSFEVK